MESSHPRAMAVVGGRDSNLLAFTTLAAALGFTPWVANSGQPWFQLAIRTLGLLALGAVSLASARGILSFSRWGERAATTASLLVLMTALSAALSVHRGKSLEAMVDGLGILGIFLATALLIRGGRWIRTAAVVQVLAAVPVALLGIAQHFRPDLVPAESSYPGRALGPFGQPNRLGGFLIASIPLALALAFAAQDRLLRAGLLLAVLILALGLIYTFSRGAWIGLGAGLIVLALFLVRWPALRPEPALAALAAALIVIPILAALPSIAARITPRPTGNPAWNLPFDPEREGSGAMRKEIWSGALAAAAARPIAGWGIGTFREAFDRSKNSRLQRLEAEGGRTADQAHSFYLETLSERGVLGLAAFLVFAGVILAGGMAALGTGAPPEVRLLSAGLLASLTALLVHALLEDNLSFTAHGTVFAACSGLLVALAPGPKREANRSASRIAGAFGLTASAACLCVGLMSASAASASLAGQAAKAAQVAPWDDSYSIAAAKAAQVSATAGGETRNARLAEAESFYRRAIAANPNDPVTRHELARLYLANPDRFGAAGARAAVSELTLALGQNPYYAEIRNDLGVALIRTGDVAGAARAFELASSGSRKFVDPLLNLAALAVRKGDRDEAIRRIDEALARDPGSERARAMKEEISGPPR